MRPFSSKALGRSLLFPRTSTGMPASCGLSKRLCSSFLDASIFSGSAASTIYLQDHQILVNRNVKTGHTACPFNKLQTGIISQAHTVCTHYKIVWSNPDITAKRKKKKLLSCTCMNQKKSGWTWRTVPKLWGRSQDLLWKLMNGERFGVIITEKWKLDLTGDLYDWYDLYVTDNNTHTMALTPRQYRSHIDLNRGCPPMSHTLMVTLPFVILRMLKPTVGIMSSLNWPDWKTQSMTYSAWNIGKW